MTENLPPQPKARKERFIEYFNEPLWSDHRWIEREPQSNEISLHSGVRLRKCFDESEGSLDAAYVDLENFFRAGNVSLNGPFEIVTEYQKTDVHEAFHIETTRDQCRIAAADADGIRRALFAIEDEMLHHRGPFLSLGTTERRPFIERRISRCCYSPIKRPGNNGALGDELADDVDYYPENYLNRLAHEGTNGLWVTLSSKDGNAGSIGFGDLVTTSITPNAGIGGEKRLAKLRHIVERCSRYGIRIYLKTMEPHLRFEIGDPAIAALPELTRIGDYYYLCASSAIGQEYLRESVSRIFSAVPNLGGLLNISHGELHTTCLSELAATEAGPIHCPRCSRLTAPQIQRNSLCAMLRGMREVSPDAELISWLYMPQPQAQKNGPPPPLADWVYEIPADTPEEVILQFNFESGVTREVFGKQLTGGDYWLSAPGPSDRFTRVAEIARRHGTKISAKIQTGTSHELATVPYLPVPSQLYQKFAAMRELGVSHAMLNWIIGSEPGLMNKAAGELSFEPFPADENTFLRSLAALYWQEQHIDAVVAAWLHFSAAYANYPLTNLFQYYGPMHDGPVWPLHLKPQDSILSPTYQLGSRITLLPWPPSGDRIGECFPEILELEEVVELCRRMSAEWDKGVEILNDLEPLYAHEPERILDIGVARALGIQFRSGFNILRFYELREKMFRTEGMERLELLQQLESLLLEELDLSEQLLTLSEKDVRLGFHADAEGYKYFPEKIRWRIGQLREVSQDDVTKVRGLIESNQALFPEYTGKNPAGPTAYAAPQNPLSKNSPAVGWRPLQSNREHQPQWSTSYDESSLFITVTCSLKGQQDQEFPFSQLQLKIESQRLFPCKNFIYDLQNESEHCKVQRRPDEMTVFAAISLSQIKRQAAPREPLRINVILRGQEGAIASWIPCNPLDGRLSLGTDNPADLGWLLFQ